MTRKKPAGREHQHGDREVFKIEVLWGTLEFVERAISSYSTRGTREEVLEYIIRDWAMRQFFRAHKRGEYRHGKPITGSESK